MIFVQKVQASPYVPGKSVIGCFRELLLLQAGALVELVAQMHHQASRQIVRNGHAGLAGQPDGLAKHMHDPLMAFFQVNESTQPLASEEPLRIRERSHCRCLTWPSELVSTLTVS